MLTTLVLLAVCVVVVIYGVGLLVFGTHSPIKWYGFLLILGFLLPSSIVISVLKYMKRVRT